MIIKYFFIFFIGSCIGSFINLASFREIRDIDIIFKRSFCENCGKKIKNRNLIPIISFIKLKGRTECCNEKIRISLFLTEILTGIMFLILYNKFAINTNLLVNNNLFLKSVIILSYLIFASIVDFKTKKVNINILFFLYIVGLLLNNIFDFTVLKILMIIGLILIYYLIEILDIPFGQGDILIFIFILLMKTTYSFFLVIYYTFICASIISIFLVITKKKDIKSEIPFVPFILMGFIIYIVV